jgi:hypothetical protein
MVRLLQSYQLCGYKNIKNTMSGNEKGSSCIKNTKAASLDSPARFVFPFLGWRDFRTAQPSFWSLDNRGALDRDLFDHIACHC